MTTKIQFKLSNDVLLTVIQMVEKTDDYIVRSIKDALLVSIKEDLIAKLEDKAKNIQKQVSILDHNKKHAIVLKYHEAYTMYKLLELVYEKEKFADHPHIKKIKRLLVDLENKVESFTTENQANDTTEINPPVLATFPSLGVNEIIIEEATILETESLDPRLDDALEDENNPTLDPALDINEIMVKNYSIFDILEEADPTHLSVEEDHSLAIEVIADETTLDPSPPQQAIVAEKIHDDIAEDRVQDTTEEVVQVIAAEPTEVAEPLEKEVEPTTPKQEEALLPSWAQQPTTPIFDGIVTKTSICIEPEDSSTCSTIEPQEEEEETLNLFEGDLPPIQPQEEKVEKEGKKEKKKAIKDNTQQGQISLF
ncbi:hypothetical protein H4K35_00820 [Myroides sp. NP-2]|uniref:hypothetical protein n=1 Tax=Myroides sp. NP-2 TaxID=2759945 RepID=UPI0015FBE55F|nr:hypothetical protein [Myroides sp. NP-2]MBB1148685.1 hypothetical protein [Myroides sp. NP-2]